jgi:hypothetical protein
MGSLFLLSFLPLFTLVRGIGILRSFLRVARLYRYAPKCAAYRLKFYKRLEF